MNRSPILFRCDGLLPTGWEEFYQCLTYGAALQRRRRPTYLMGRLDPLSLATAVHRAGSEWIGTSHPIGSPEDCEATVREALRLNAGAIVVAGQDLSTSYLRELASSGALIVVLDSEAAVTFPAGLIINPLLTPGMDLYQFDRGAQLLLGGRYALVRPIFRRHRPLRAQEPLQPFRAMIALGDDDHHGQTLIRAKEMLATTRVEKISAVVRPHHSDLEDLKELAREYASRFEVIGEPNEIATRLGRSHFAITSGDGFSLELACVGMPQLIIPQHPKHAANGQRLDDEGAATYLGFAEQVSDNDLRQAVNVLLSDPLERLGMSRCARQLIDGRGPDRLVNGLEIMLRAPQRQVDRLAA